MAGYSGTPLPQKLGIKPSARLGLMNAPKDFRETLGALPEGVTIADAPRGKGPFQVIVCFARTRAELDKGLALLPGKLDASGGLWIAWPKKIKAQTSGGAAAARPPASDLSETQVRQMGLATGLVDNKVCAIDEVWSGLRFVVRLVDRSRFATTRAS